MWIRGALVRLVVVAAIALLTACGDTSENHSPSATVTVRPANIPLDDATTQPTAPPAQTFTTSELPRLDLEGLRQIIRETAAQKRVLVIDIWATWCLPCMQSFPSIHEGMKKFGDKARLVTLSFDLGDTEPAAMKFLAEQHALADAYITPSADERATIAREMGKKVQEVSPPMIYVFDQQGAMVTEETEGDAGLAGRVVGKVAKLVGQ